jgi:hypothetical protein
MRILIILEGCSNINYIKELLSNFGDFDIQLTSLEAIAAFAKSTVDGKQYDVIYIDTMH